MHLIDNFIRDKFLQDISILVSQYGIDESLSPYSALIRFLIISEYFGEEIFRIYIEHYKRNFIILEILATKQGLDIQRQVFKLVRNYITKDNIKLTITYLVSLYLSHTHKEIIHTLEPITPSGIRITNLE